MNACRKKGPRYGVMQVIRGCDDDKIDAVPVGCFERGHVLIGRIGALEKPGGSTFAGDLRVRGQGTRDNLCLAVEFSGNSMHRSNECATPATHDTGPQAARGLGNASVTHTRQPPLIRNAFPSNAFKCNRRLASAPRSNTGACGSRTSIAFEPGAAPRMSTASSTARSPKLIAVISSPAFCGSSCTSTSSPFACTPGTSTNRAAYKCRFARTSSRCASCEANESGFLSCCGSGPYRATARGKPPAERISFGFEPTRT